MPRKTTKTNLPPKPTLFQKRIAYIIWPLLNYSTPCEIDHEEIAHSHGIKGGHVFNALSQLSKLGIIKEIYDEEIRKPHYTRGTNNTIRTEGGIINLNNSREVKADKDGIRSLKRTPTVTLAIRLTTDTHELLKKYAEAMDIPQLTLGGELIRMSLRYFENKDQETLIQTLQRMLVRGAEISKRKKQIAKLQKEIEDLLET